ncbi:MAG: hypothetical protein OXH67_16510 [Acidimicrobiaceae bacterium]|nr:hypothetical protein [Acidimicrobiaceae bacterium]
MDTTALDSNTITLMVTIAGSWLTLVGVIIFQTSRLDTKLDTKFDALAGDVADARERLARMEGHLMGLKSVASDPSPTPPEDGDDDHRQAG